MGLFEQRKGWDSEMKWKPAKGELVYPCYDGKWGRAVHGEVVRTLFFGMFIQVQMDEWAGDERGLKPWFRRKSDRHYGGFVKVRDSLMRAWFGLPGDWYSVLKKETLDEYWGEGKVVK